jgi:hypothetical protein
MSRQGLSAAGITIEEASNELETSLKRPSNGLATGAFLKWHRGVP